MSKLRPLGSLVALVAFGSGGGAPANAPAITFAPRSYVITAHDYAYSGVPKRIPAGWVTLRLVNNGRELHMIAIDRVPAGHTVLEMLDSLAHDRSTPDVEDWGGPNVVGPGDTSTMTMFYPVGSYIFACAVEGADGKMHVTKGMMSSFQVTPSVEAGRDPARAADPLVTLSDYHIALSGPAVGRGTHAVRVHNAARQSHDLQIVQILPGHSEKQALEWFEHPTKHAPAARAVGGVSAIAPGLDALVPVTLVPGTYIFFCWVPDEKQQAHFHRGMRQTVIVGATT